MRLRIALVLTALVAAAPLAAGDPAARQDQTPRSGLVDPLASEVIALERDRDSRYTLPVLVDGIGPFAFMIDTGSQATAVTQELRSSARLASAGTATVVGMASRRQVDLVDVGRIDFGSNSYANFAAPVLARENIGADGIIGLDALQDFRVLIDFRQHTIAVEDPRRKQKDRGFDIVVRARNRLGQLLISDAMVEGVRAMVIIDTGAQASVGNLALRERIRAKRAQEVVTTDVNGVDIVGQLAFVRSLTIKGLSLTEVPLTFADAPAFAALGLQDRPVLSLGMQHLALFDRVAIDFERQQVLFDVPADVERALREARRGHSYSPRF